MPLSGGEALLEGVEDGGGVAARLEGVDHVADRADGLDQAPERAEQPEEDEQAGHVAQHVAGFVQPGGDRVENAAHHLRGDRHAADAIAQEHGHRREQDRRTLDGETRIGQPEAVHPVDLGEQADDLPEGERDADEEHGDDQGIESRIGEERGPDLLVEHDDRERAQRQEHHHPDEKDPGRAELNGSMSCAMAMGSAPYLLHNKARTRRKEEGARFAGVVDGPRPSREPVPLAEGTA